MNRWKKEKIKAIQRCCSAVENHVADAVAEFDSDNKIPDEIMGYAVPMALISYALLFRAVANYNPADGPLNLQQDRAAFLRLASDLYRDFAGEPGPP